MPAVPRLDHVNIQTMRLAETVAFYRDIVGLVASDPPPPLDPALVQWMGAPGQGAIFHFTTPGSIGSFTQGADTGAVHHVALDCTGHDAMVARLAERGLDHHLNHVRAIDLKQIFVRDPNGVLLELNYRAGQH